MTLDEMRAALGREDEIAFEPVPRLRRRRGGRRTVEGSGGAKRRWKAVRRGSEAAQRDFIAALSLTGPVRAAAEVVGMSARSAYRLAAAPGADDFARAWDEALDTGITETRTRSLQRALFGEVVPVFRKGVVVGLRHKRADKLALAVLGSDKRDVLDIEDQRRSAVFRRQTQAAWKAFDEKKAAEEREKTEQRAEYQRQVDAMIERAKAEDRWPRPRVRML